MSREAVKYIITLERLDGKSFDGKEDECETVSVSFQSDNHLSKEYIQNFKKAIYAITDNEVDKYYKTIRE